MLRFINCFRPIASSTVISTVIVMLLSITPAISMAASENDSVAFEHSYISCSIITSEHLTTLQLYQRGLPLDVALESLPNISRSAKKRVKYIYDMAKKYGILNTYADINTNYARCSTLVYQQRGKPAIDRLAHGYYYCAGENRIRFDMILNIDQKWSLEKLLQSVTDKHKSIARNYFQLIESKGILAAFDLTANNLKSCLKQLNE